MACPFARDAIRLTGMVQVLLLATLWPLPEAQAATAPRTATTASGAALRIQGSVVIIEPDIELTVVTAGGLQEPRKDWSTSARRLYPQAVRDLLAGRQTPTRPDFDLPEALDPASRLGQVVRLNRAVALSIGQWSQPGSVLATKKDPATGKPRMDWTLGTGVGHLREATGADYALFTYIRDSYSSGGRNALRIIPMFTFGGGTQVGMATLVDLRSGQVVWFNLMSSQSGDLRDEAGARATAAQLLEGLPL